jgi:hypothetical protein
LLVVLLASIERRSLVTRFRILGKRIVASGTTARIYNVGKGTLIRNQLEASQPGVIAVALVDVTSHQRIEPLLFFSCLSLISIPNYLASNLIDICVNLLSINGLFVML